MPMTRPNHIGCSFREGSWRVKGLAPLGIALMTSLCASCVLPLTLKYYVPYAENGEVISTSCSGDPPYAISTFAGVSPRFHLMVSLVPSMLTVIIHPDQGAGVALDPTLIGIEVDGKRFALKSVRYRVGKSGAAQAIEAQGRIDINTDYLIVELPVDLGRALNVVTQLPPITVAGQVVEFPNVSFKLERHTRLITIVGNC
jgi:hypothetical protein